MGANYTKQELEQLVAAVPFWWHSIDLGQGITTRGHKTPKIHSSELNSFRLPDLRGKTVLDIGAWDGFHSFEAERRGASRVVALDHYVWSIDFAPQKTAKSFGEGSALPELRRQSGPDLPGKRGFDTAHAALDSKVEDVVGDFMCMELSALGTFDVVLFFGVLYHMQNPLGSLQRLAGLTKGVAIIETQAVVVAGYEDYSLWEFYPGDELQGDPTNWFAPNAKTLLGACRAAGFTRVEMVAGPPVHVNRGQVCAPDSVASKNRTFTITALLPMPGSRCAHTHSETMGRRWQRAFKLSPCQQRDSRK